MWIFTNWWLWKEVNKYIFCIPFFQTLLKLVVLRYYFSDIFLEKEGNLNGKIFSLAEFLPFKKNHNENYNQVVTLVRFVYFGSCASFSIMSGLWYDTLFPNENFCLVSFWNHIVQKKLYSHYHTGLNQLSYIYKVQDLFDFRARAQWSSWKFKKIM